MTSVTTYYLEMMSPEDLKSKPQPDGLTIVEAEIKQYRFNRYLYQLVGENWLWNDKLTLPDTSWKAYAENDNLRTWVAYYKGSIAGYFELQHQDAHQVEIAYFGLAPGYIGRGFGGYLLSTAIKYAWEWQGTERVWVHTCTLDHDSALNNYQARGMQLYKQVEES